MKKWSKTLVTMFIAAVSTVAVASKVSPETVSGATTVDSAKAKGLFDKGVVFVDTRNDKDWDAGRIPGAKHLDSSKALSVDSLGKHAKKDQEVVFYCNGTSCLRSSEAAAKAVGWGYSKVYYYRLGFPDWKGAGYPTE
jgi:rhodanese-related sulfurtransferase